eukprot:CAMPEP_0119350106 /NCGR_PEP_ID=MMETSP1333-20130426/109888_1 /TAXON_ID=418940 /ORGANISM="Scyphosphaera apsteinii, Strain RCC1455" /LENGTH=80 /DNA_ID=CAMNT_0007362715 /DNA_START=493 /DNA_END=735 /DNA_ORIENTATION=-
MPDDLHSLHGPISTDISTSIAREGSDSPIKHSLTACSCCAEAPLPSMVMRSRGSKRTSNSPRISFATIAAAEAGASADSI